MSTNQLLIIIMIFLLLLLLIIIAGLVFYIVTKKNEAPEQIIKDPTKNLKELIENSKKESKQVVAICGICEKELYKENHYEVEKLHFCKEHFSTYTDNKWKQISNQRTTSDTPEAGIHIYNFKQSKWDTEEIPMFIQCEYKIDITNDHIETYVQLYAIEDNADELKIQLEKGNI